MILKETTVYVPTTLSDMDYQTVLADVSNDSTDTLYLNKRQLFTFNKEQLIALLGSVWDKCWAETGDGWNGEIHPLNYITERENKMYLEVKESIIQSLFNTEEDVK